MFYFRSFSKKQWIFCQGKNVDIFEKWIHFLILCIIKKMKLRYRPGGLRPLTPCAGGMIAFKWPGRPPRKNPGDATKYRKEAPTNNAQSP